MNTSPVQLKAAPGVKAFTILSVMVGLLSGLVSVGWFQLIVPFIALDNIHAVHTGGLGAILGILIPLPAAIQVWNPQYRVSMTRQLILALMIGGVVMSFQALRSPAPLILTSILSLGLVALHPERRRLTRLSPRGWSAELVLLGVGAPAWLVFAGRQVSQETLVAFDPHQGHWIAMGGVGMAIPLVLAVAALDDPRLWASRMSGSLTAIYLGVLSLILPNHVSSLGALGGGLAIVWAVLLILAVLRLRSRDVRESRNLS